MTDAPSPAFERLQREVGEWSEEHFGDQPVVNPLLGVGEEFGELCEAASRDEPTEHELDCVGDGAERRAVALLLARLSAYADARGYTLDECVRVAWDEEVSTREWDSSYVE